MLSPAYGYAIMACAAGVLLLLWWLHSTTDNPRSNTLLAKSLWLFVAPGAVIWALPDRMFDFTLSMWVLILLEEGLKASARLAEPDRMNRFWLIMLFGIWELMLAKPLWGLANQELINTWSRVEIFGLMLGGLIAVLMHSVTATIYAFRFQKSIGAAFVASWTLHVLYNEIVDWIGTSPVALGLLAIVLLIVLLAVWPRRPPSAEAQQAA